MLAYSTVAFVQDCRAFSRRAVTRGEQPPLWGDRFPCLGEKTATTQFDGHYIYHTAWAARVLAKTKPAYHIDVSSIIYFAGIISAFLRTKHYDYRPPALSLDNLEVGFADLLNLPFQDASVNSLSCMHTLEHIGLGRYGDPLDPKGDVKAAMELRRVLAPGGTLLVVTPVGRPRVCFNAHRVYSFDQICEFFGGLHLREFRLLSDGPLDLGLIEADSSIVAQQNYGCGCFWFQSLPS
jgi:SAM-dependent methyltransferase